MKLLDEHLADRTYLTGPTFTIADAHCYAIAMWTHYHDIDLAPWPNLAGLPGTHRQAAERASRQGGGAGGSAAARLRGQGMTARWTHRPEASNWGEFGPDDQLGAMNLVGREQVLKGLAEARTGLTFSLLLPLELAGRQRAASQPPSAASLCDPARRQECAGEQCFCFALQRDNPLLTDVVSDDVVLLHTQYSTQWDGLAHMGSLFDSDGSGTPEITFYNGYRPRHGLTVAEPCERPEAWTTYENPRADVLGIENLARHGVQGRAVLVDLARHYGRENHAVTYDDLQRILEKDGIVIEKGDMVCFYTGLDDLILGMGGKPDAAVLQRSCAGLEGRDKRLLSWITDTGIAALISDISPSSLCRRRRRRRPTRCCRCTSIACSRTASISASCGSCATSPWAAGERQGSLPADGAAPQSPGRSGLSRDTHCHRLGELRRFSMKRRLFNLSALAATAAGLGRPAASPRAGRFLSAARRSSFLRAGRRQGPARTRVCQLGGAAPPVRPSWSTTSPAPTVLSRTATSRGRSRTARRSCWAPPAPMRSGR